MCFEPDLLRKHQERMRPEVFQSLNARSGSTAIIE